MPQTNPEPGKYAPPTDHAVYSRPSNILLNKVIAQLSLFKIFGTLLTNLETCIFTYVLTNILQNLYIYFISS